MKNFFIQANSSSRCSCARRFCHPKTSRSKIRISKSTRDTKISASFISTLLSIAYKSNNYHSVLTHSKRERHSGTFVSLLRLNKTICRHFPSMILWLIVVYCLLTEHQSPPSQIPTQHVSSFKTALYNRSQFHLRRCQIQVQMHNLRHQELQASHHNLPVRWKLPKLAVL